MTELKTSRKQFHKDLFGTEGPVNKACLKPLLCVLRICGAVLRERVWVVDPILAASTVDD